MPVIRYKTFKGEIPRLIPELLPPEHAQLATNCDFAEGSLRPMKGGQWYATLSTNPTRGVFSVDGTNAYSWTAETLSFDSPIISDAYNRMYYMQPSVGELRVADKSGMGAGGSPATSFLVGVPRPTDAPTLVTVDRSSLPDYSSVTVAARAWWDYDGKAYSEQAVTLTTGTAFKVYTFSQPALPGSPPANVTPVLTCKLTITDNNNGGATIMTITCRAGSSARSNALPGSVEMRLHAWASATATIELVWGIADTIGYTYTLENTWGEESAPAPPATISVTYLQDVKMTGAAPSFTGYRPFNRFHAYRTYGANMTYVRCYSGTTAPFTDVTHSPPASAVALESTEYYPPPTGLEGLAIVPGGWVVAFKDNLLYKSAPYKPHAWPYTEKFPTHIRGVCVGASAIIVTCADGVYLVSAGSPARGGYVKLGSPQAGVAQRSMAQIDGAVAYLSNDGLVLVEGSLASIEASQRLFTRKKWREMFAAVLDDASLRLAYHDGCLVGTSHTTATGFVLRLDEDVGNFTRIDWMADTTIQMVTQDALYYAQGASIYRFMSGSDLTMDWWGKDWVFPSACAMGCGYASYTGTITLKLYADDVLVETLTLTAGTTTFNGFFRPTYTGRARKWSVRVQGTGFVLKEMVLAQTQQELKIVQ